MSEITRRTFVKGTLVTSLVVTGSGCGNDVKPAPIADVEVDDTPDSPRYGQIAVPIPAYPQLQAAGGAIMLRPAMLPPGARPFTVPERGILLIHRGTPDDPPEFIATRADCPHQGCPLGYSAEDGLIECPCHGSRFRAIADANDMNLCVGLVVHPPAQDNLTVYALQHLGDYVYVDLRTDLSCGTRTDFPPVMGGRIMIPIDQYPVLAMVGGTLIGKPAGLDDKLMVARTAPDTVVAVSAVCTHRGCTIGLRTDEARFHCPCHNSEFAYDGSVLSLPSTGEQIGPIKSYPVQFDGSIAAITVG